MPFQSDKQRRYLWANKPEVAKKFSQHRQSGGGVYSDGTYDSAAKWWSSKLAGVPQHVGFVDDPDDITETAATNPDDPYGGKYINPDRKAPLGRYTDLATYYTAKDRAMGRGERELARMAEENRRLKEEAMKRGFKFQEGGGVPMMDNRKPKKVTHKDRYGNQITTEYESETKPLDLNSLFERYLDMGVPELMIPESSPIGGGVTIGFADAHPGEPKGQDTVPAWLTPGEFVVNKEGMEDPEDAALVKAINDKGRAKQMNRGGMMPRVPPVKYYEEGGTVSDLYWVDGGLIPMSPTEALLRAREGYRSDVYLDSLKKPTVGHGHLLPDEYKERVGETPFSDEELDTFFQQDIETAQNAAQANAKKYGVDWDKLPRRAKTALVSQAFQLGETGQGNFENMWTALAAGDHETAALEALDSKWAEQTPERAKDLYNSLTPGLGFQKGGPIYAYRGYDTAMQDAADIEDPNTDLSSGWTPPVYGMDDISPMEQAILNQEAAPSESEYQQRLAQQIAMAENMVAGGDGDDLGREVPVPTAEEDSWWENVMDWTFDTSVADERNAKFNEKAAEANNEAAEENLAELEARVEAGQPVNSHSLEQAKAAVEHTQEAHTDAIIEAAQYAGDEIDAEGVVAAEAVLQHSNVPGSDDDKAALDELAESEEFNDEDDPSKPSEKGQQSTQEVVTAGEEAAKADPTLVDKAQGFFKDAFKDLFDGKELARMAIMYVGSRALGYSHGGSLNWAAKQYVQRLDTKQETRANNAKEFAKSGKYTPASVAAYQKSGDLSDLVSAGASYTPTGKTSVKMIDGKQVPFEEVKDADGGVYYRSPTGKVVGAGVLATARDYEPAFDKGTPEYRARRSRATGDAAGRFEEVWKADDTWTDGQNTGHHTKIRPKQAADEFWAWSESMGLDPESDEALQVMTMAYQQAIADGKTGEVKPTSLKPYLEQQYIRESTGAPELFSTNPNRKPGEMVKYVRGDKMAKLNREVQSLASSMPKLQGLAPQDAASRFYELAVKEWNALDPEIKDLNNSSATDGESGFYFFLTQRMAKLKGKLGA